MPEIPGLTRQAKLACVRRELALRRNVYPNMVKRGRMKQELADREIEVMAAIVADYEDARREAEWSDIQRLAARAAALEEAALAVELFKHSAGDPIPEIVLLLRSLKVADA